MFICQDDALLAYQTAFDLAENENQAFLLNVRNHLGALSSHTSAHVYPASRLVVQSNQTNAATEPSEDVQMRDDITMPNDSAATMDPNAATHPDRLTNQGYIVRRDIYSVDVAVPIQP
jgi:26S proteasome regulatory subunit N2